MIEEDAPLWFVLCSMFKWMTLFLQEVISMGSEDESVEQKSAARKEALRALRAAKELSESKEDGEGDAAVEEE